LKLPSVPTGRFLLRDFTAIISSNSFAFSDLKEKGCPGYS